MPLRSSNVTPGQKRKHNKQHLLLRRFAKDNYSVFISPFFTHTEGCFHAPLSTTKMYTQVYCVNCVNCVNLGKNKYRKWFGLKRENTVCRLLREFLLFGVSAFTNEIIVQPHVLDHFMYTKSQICTTLNRSYLL